MQVSRTSGVWFFTWTALLLPAAGLPASEFSERLAAWQGVPASGPVAPATHEQHIAVQEPVPQAMPLPAPQPSPRVMPGAPWDGYAPGGYTCGPGGCGPAGCDTCGDFGPHGNQLCCGKPLWWARFELLLWWRQGRDLPPLVTTDPVSEDSTTAGILPDATILLGGDDEPSDLRAGGRLDIGFWLDERQCTGLGYRFFGLGNDDMRFRASSLDNPVLAIPFFDLTAGQNESLLVAYPGLVSGRVAVDGSSSVVGNDLYARFLWCRDCDSRLDFVTGWHFSTINDELRLRTSSEVTETGGNIPIGTTTDVLDEFDARNQFHGVILGLIHEYECKCWSWQTTARVSLGNMRQRIRVDGRTRIAVPGDDPDVTAGGLFTAPGTNIGEFERDEFCAVTEVGVTLHYHVGPCTKLSVGYSFIHWSDVLRAGEQIDTVVGDDRPRLTLDNGDFWVQGINFGLVREF